MEANKEKNGSKMFFVFMKTLLDKFGGIKDAALNNSKTREIIENAYKSRNFGPLVPLWKSLAKQSANFDIFRTIVFRNFLKEFQQHDPYWLFFFFDDSSEKCVKDYAKQLLPFLHYSLLFHDLQEFKWDAEFDAEEFVQWCVDNNHISYLPDIGTGAYFLWRCFPRFHTWDILEVQKLSEDRYY